MATHRTRVGLHARNDVRFTEGDYDLIGRAKIETLKMMSQTDVGVFDRVRQTNPKVEFIVRLYDDRFGVGSRPTFNEKLARMNCHIFDLARSSKEIEGKHSHIFQERQRVLHCGSFFVWCVRDQTLYNIPL